MHIALGFIPYYMNNATVKAKMSTDLPIAYIDVQYDRGRPRGFARFFIDMTDKEYWKLLNSDNFYITLADEKVPLHIMTLPDNEMLANVEL